MTRAVDAGTPDWLATLCAHHRVLGILWQDPPPPPPRDHLPGSWGTQIPNGDTVPLMPPLARRRLVGAAKLRPGKWIRAFDGTARSSLPLARIFLNEHRMDVAVRGFGATVAVFIRWAPNPGLSKEPRRRAPRPRVEKRTIHPSHDPEPDGHRAFSGLLACRRCLRFLVIERRPKRVTDDGEKPCKFRDL